MASQAKGGNQKNDSDYGPAKGNNRDPLQKGHPQDHDANKCTCSCPMHPPPAPAPEVKMFACGHKKGGRSLIVCIDGTANQFGMKNTNVIELYNLILKGTGDNQLTWYNSGIGTYVRPDRWSPANWKQSADHKIDLALAWRFKQTVLKAYRWLSENYQDGDCIYLFGFSRGAFQVRALAGMIEKVGLIHKGNEAQIPFAYELYVDPNSGNPITAQVGSNIADRVSMAERFKKAFSRRDVKVHFVGAWDTVSSIGIARGKCTLPLTAEGMTHVCYFRHALALDERRVKFLPELAWGGTTLPPPSIIATVGHHSRERPHTLEVWFPGTHSDIGGGNVTNASMDRGRPPLRWMASQAAELGLRLEAFPRELSPTEQIELRESLSFGWKIFEILPFRRLTYARTSGAINSTTRMPHLGAGRKIHEGQKIHVSFIEGRTEFAYLPKARPITNSPTFWEDLHAESLPNSAQLIERDVFYRAADAVRKLLGGEEVAELFKEIIADPTGYQFLYDEVIEAVRSWDRRDQKLDLEAKCRFLGTAIALFPSDLSNLKLESWGQNSTLLDDILRDDSSQPEHRGVARHFRSLFLKDIHCSFLLEGHTSPALSVAFSPDSSRVVSGSMDCTVRIWDPKTGLQAGEPLRGHSDSVSSVVFSPDGRCIVSGSHDTTVRIWDLKAGKPVGAPLEHASPVFSVAISPDGKKIASGCADGTVWMWDVETREHVRTLGQSPDGPLESVRARLLALMKRGHTNVVRSVAFSPDSKRIVSGSYDETIRIWDAENGEQVGESLEVNNWVVSVAVSRDGKQIVSASNGPRIRIWDMETGAQVGEFATHKGCVASISISSDGEYIVTGSSDRTIGIWDLKATAQIGLPLEGHTDEVFSVAISPDGKQIVSSSNDNTVRVWSTEEILYQ